MKNGTTRRGKQNYKCRDCGRQFVENPQWKPIDPDRKAMIDRLQKRETSPSRNRPCDGSVGGLVARICQRLLRCAGPQQVQVKPKTQGQLTVQMDELWSFVDDKGNKQWVWLAQDVTTREIVGCYIGDRSLGCCKGIMGLAAACVATMCRHLYRLLAGL
ncbi:IS1 family transposase [Microcoleus sp. MON2_D5]